MFIGRTEQETDDLVRRKGVSVPYRGFWSYVHKDDEVEGERISQLARDVVAQYEMITGEEIELFLDKERLEWGDKWRDKIDAHLESVAFFIPVMTPRYFKSAECRVELNQIVRRASKLGRKDLLLPLYYLDVPSIEKEGEEDDLILMIREFHWQDWRDLRFKDVNSEAYRRGVSDMAQRLVRANKHAETDNVDELAPDMEQETDEDDDMTGTIDRLAKMEVALPELNETVNEIAGQITIVGNVMSEGASDVKQVSTGRDEFARRVKIVRRVAAQLNIPTDKISTLTNRYASQLHDVDEGIRIFIEQAPVEIEEDPASKKQFCHFFESVETLSEASHKSFNDIQSMIDTAAPIEKMSRDLRPVIRRLRQALTIMVESRSVSGNWKDLIETSGVDCREFTSSIE